jgi:hypothetical protein
MVPHASLLRKNPVIVLQKRVLMFLDQMSRDQKTDDLCDKNGIVLIRIPHIYSYIEREKMEEFILEELHKNGF